MKKTSGLLLLSGLICLNSQFAQAENVVVQDFDAVAAAVEAKFASLGSRIEQAVESLYADAKPYVETLGQNLLTNIEHQISNSVELNNLMTLLSTVEANPNLANVAAFIQGAISDLKAEAADLKSGFLAIHSAQQAPSVAAKQAGAAQTSAIAASAVATRAANSAQVTAVAQLVRSATAPAPASSTAHAGSTPAPTK